MPRDVLFAADIGGTFTDVVLEVRGRRIATKLLTTPKAPEAAVVEGARRVLQSAQLDFADIDLFVHGTTLATNAVIERKGAKTGLIATAGFRDVVEIADESRFDQYDIFIEKPKPLVPRSARLTVPERMDVEGRVRLALDETAVRHCALVFKTAGIEAVAVAYLHSYANAAHEVRTREILREELPGVEVTLSSEVCPEAREYDRTSTTIANAYVQPLMAGYLRRLERQLQDLGCRAALQLMMSGGNLTSLDTAARFPIRLVESGPAGGAILAAGIAAERGENRILSFDMGGTTAKICLIDHGQPFKARTFEVDRSSRFMKGSGLPVRIPVIEMVEIGAGGGSIAGVDDLGRINVGPESAGSEPGPACYGRGGRKPTVTDADLVLGKIDPVHFAGGQIPLRVEEAVSALAGSVGEALGLANTLAAYGITEIVDENMANAARVHSVERGVSVADHTLVAFGGAAPLHVSRLAEKLGIRRIIVPADAGVGSAIGFLRAPAAYEVVRSRHMRLSFFDASAANGLLEDMSREARTLAAGAAGGRELVEDRRAFMRYVGQGHEIAVKLPMRAMIETDREALRSAFEAEYRALFARHIPNAAIEFMTWTVSVSTAVDHIRLLDPVTRRNPARSVGMRDVFDARAGRSESIPVFDRSLLEPGDLIEGPALVREAGTTTFVSRSFDARVDAGHALVLTAKEIRA